MHRGLAIQDLGSKTSRAQDFEIQGLASYEVWASKVEGACGCREYVGFVGLYMDWRVGYYESVHHCGFAGFGLIAPITHIVTLLIPITNPLTKSL